MATGGPNVPGILGLVDGTWSTANFAVRPLDRSFSAYLCVHILDLCRADLLSPRTLLPRPLGVRVQLRLQRVFYYNRWVVAYVRDGQRLVQLSIFKWKLQVRTLGAVHVAISVYVWLHKLNDHPLMLLC